jgi:hypothetical protein
MRTVSTLSSESEFFCQLQRIRDIAICFAECGTSESKSLAFAT